MAGMIVIFCRDRRTHLRRLTLHRSRVLNVQPTAFLIGVPINQVAPICLSDQIASDKRKFFTEIWHKRCRWLHQNLPRAPHREIINTHARGSSAARWQRPHTYFFRHQRELARRKKSQLRALEVCCSYIFWTAAIIEECTWLVWLFVHFAPCVCVGMKMQNILVIQRARRTQWAFLEKRAFDPAPIVVCCAAHAINLFATCSLMRSSISRFWSLCSIVSAK